VPRRTPAGGRTARRRDGAGAGQGKIAFYGLIDRLSTGRHTFGSAVTRRQTANRPAGPFTPTLVSRPGEQVQIDSTPIDVMVLAADGVPVRWACASGWLAVTARPSLCGLG
jgi:hypothetical protein